MMVWAVDDACQSNERGGPCPVATGVESSATDAAAATDDSLQAWAETTLTGDWQGQRRQLAAAGWQIDLLYTADFLRNFSGGQQRGSAYVGHLDLIAQLDGEKLLGWSGGSGYLQLIGNGGGRFNQTRVNSLMGVDNFEAPVNRTGIFRAWLQQSLFNDRVSLRGGLYPVDTEFYVTDSSANFLHPSFGIAAEPSAFGTRAGLPIYPTSAYGLRLRVAPDPSWYAMLALTRGVPADRAPNGAANVSWRHGSGSLTIGEIGFSPVRSAMTAVRPEASNEHAMGDDKAANKTDEDKTSDKAEGLSPISKVAVGAWRFAPHQEQMTALGGSGEPLHASHWGAYFLAEQTVFRFPGDQRDITLFLRTGMADGRTSLLDRSTSFGLSWRGPFASREKDTFGLAATRTHASHQGREQLAMSIGQPVGSTTETVVEMTYQARVTPGLIIQPMVQRIFNPGLYLAHATVAGARFQLAF
ncbi:MAG: carbohydrate porin [Candidatus Accumulibacter sp.]|nr:carbohydrate porin [Accumulibacter sp.]